MNHTKQALFRVDWDEDALHPAVRNIRLDRVDPVSGISIQLAEHVDGKYAAFIVRACNAHDDLVEALEMLMQTCQEEGHLIRLASYRQAVSALKLARGE